MSTKPEFEDEDDFEIDFDNDTDVEDLEDEDIDQEEDDEEEDDDEELVGFSEEQRKKIEKITRKVKEERDEAITFAQNTVSRAKHLEGRLTEAEKLAVTEIKSSTEAELTTLREQLKDAIETGDADAQVELNEKIGDVKIRQRMAAQAEKAIGEPRADDTPTIPPDDIARHKSWFAKNASWFDNSFQSGDPEMTAVALATDQKLKASGVRPNSPEYFAAIDKRMSELYPEKFGKAAPAKDRQKPKQKTAPVRRSSSDGGKVRVVVTPGMRRVAKRLGLDIKDYVKSYVNYEKEQG